MRRWTKRQYEAQFTNAITKSETRVRAMMPVEVRKNKRLVCGQQSKCKDGAETDRLPVDVAQRYIR
jgi:hypothetical protein